MTMGIVEFLEARIVEDEWVAKSRLKDQSDVFSWPHEDGQTLSLDLDYSRRHGPARVLREVEAKRAIIKAYVDADIKAHDTYNFHEDILNGESNGLETAVEALAICWSDHPDFNEEWRP